MESLASLVSLGSDTDTHPVLKEVQALLAESDSPLDNDDEEEPDADEQSSGHSIELPSIDH